MTAPSSLVQPEKDLAARAAPHMSRANIARRMTDVLQYVCRGQSINIPRYCNKDYDALVIELNHTVHSERRGEIVKKLNNMVIVDSYTIVSLAWRGFVIPISNSFGRYALNVWDTQLWNAQDWC